MFNMETCHRQVFEIIVVDKIMKKFNISEDKAVEVLDYLYSDIKIFSDECRIKNGYSMRQGVINRINKLKSL